VRRVFRQRGWGPADGCSPGIRCRLMGFGPSSQQGPSWKRSRPLIDPRPIFLAAKPEAQMCADLKSLRLRAGGAAFLRQAGRSARSPRGRLPPRIKWTSFSLPRPRVEAARRRPRPAPASSPAIPGRRPQRGLITPHTEPPAVPGMGDRAIEKSLGKQKARSNRSRQ